MIFKAVGYVLYILLFGQTCDVLSGRPAESWRTAFFKVLPIFHLVFIAMSTTVKTKGHATYKRNIILGLGCFILSDTALVWKKHFLLGLAAAAAGQALYVRTLGLRPRGVPALMVASGLVGALAFLYLRPAITDPTLQALVGLYCCLLATLLWRSTVTVQVNASVGAVCAVLGSLAFIAADVMLAQDRFVAPIQDAQIYILITYFLAQLFITASVAYYKPHPYRRDDDVMYTYKERLN